MIKKITLAVIILFSTYVSASAQFAINIVNAHDPTYEGETVSYKVIYTNLPSRHELLATVVNGVIIAQNLEPSPVQGSITVKWNCKDINGSISVSETGTSISATLNIDIHSFINDPNYCSTVIPVKQNLTYGQPVAMLNVTYCSPSCNANDITYFYQWQVGDVPICTFPQVPATWSNIPNQIGSSMLPPVYNSDCIKAYRRITTFTHQGINYTKYSAIAVISTFDFLSPGTLSGGITFNNGVPAITQTPAAGGLCDGCNYMYNWQLSTDNFHWANIGQAINYPAGVQIPGNCYIRRGVECNGEILYTNILTINPPPLNPGSIDGGGTVSFNTVPVVTQTGAFGSVCTPPDFIYSWERSINNGAWVPFGTGINYPLSGNIIGTCRIRRKVHCVYEDAYTPYISFTMLPYSSPNAENLNYVRVNDIVIPGVHSWEQADALSTGNKLQSTTYLDNFGRGIQSVVKQGSLKQSITGLDANDLNSYQDLVSHMQYDGLGRADKEFLSYASTTNLGFFKTNAQAEQQSFINQKYNEPINSSYTYSQTTYDGSPLNRIINVKVPGALFNNDPNYKGISSDLDFNKQVENIRIWDIVLIPGLGEVPMSTVAYGDNLLTKSITKDEKDKIIVTYIDLSGNAILKRVQDNNAVNDNSYTGWLNTYYVYDDFGRLRYTITPKAVAIMAQANNWSIDQDIKKGLCFYQEYDKRGRINVKHSPDGGEVWLVYDNRDRLVLSQDENQRNRGLLIPAKLNQWSFSLYDENDRVLSTGLINDSRDRSAIQTFVDGLNVQNQQIQIYTGVSETITAYNPVIINLNASDIFINSVSYYDDYSHKPITQNNINLSANDFAPTTNQYAEQPEVSLSRIRGSATVSKVRILDDKYDNGNIYDEHFLTSTSYFDIKGRVIQSYADNIKGGIDASAVLYDYAGRVLGTRGKHAMVIPGTSTPPFDGLIVVTKNDYDLLGRATKLWKLYTKNNSDIANLNKYKKLSEVKLDEFGTVKTKTIGEDPNPNNAGLPIETLEYNYNIQGWLTGVNKDYAMANSGSINQFKRRFGFYLGYENGDNNFTAAQYNGSITGVIWRSQGDNAIRKYNYEYDNINRFKNAVFSQKDNPATANWSATQVDLSASVSGYDDNGNIQGMMQKGIVPGTNGGIILDNLQYHYYDNDKSNKLKSITDLANIAFSGKQGDFKDYAATNDYEYDFNGNLKYDKNKNIIDAASNQSDPNPNAGIISNFLDLPQQITVKGKSITEYTYDAGGNKLAKKVTQLNSGTPSSKTTFYVGGFVYEGNDLQYILNEEGKLRIMTPVTNWVGTSQQVFYLDNPGIVSLSPADNKWGVWDYYLKDNLGNIRMVLTEEIHQQQMHCSMEDANPLVKAEEESTFSDPVLKEVFNSRQQKPADWQTNLSAKVSKLLNPVSGSGSVTMGPNTILKVMAGDEVVGSANYFYYVQGSTQSNGIANIVTNSLLAALGNYAYTGSSVKDNIATTIPPAAIGGVNNFITDKHPSAVPGSIAPRAYLNYIFFDEQFRYVPDCSGAIPVGDNGGTAIFREAPLPAFYSKATKNGYVFIYLSNESDKPVYFDELHITHNRGPVMEDNAYYPFGLKIQGISAKAAEKHKIKEGYQGIYNEQDEETGYNEFALRFYDSQIGRWLQIDPNIIDPGMYNGMGNDPINQVDPDGGDYYKNSREQIYWSKNTAATYCDGDEEWVNIGKTYVDYTTHQLENKLTAVRWLEGGKWEWYDYGAESEAILDDIMKEGATGTASMNEKGMMQPFSYENKNAAGKGVTFLGNMWINIWNRGAGIVDAVKHPVDFAKTAAENKVKDELYKFTTPLSKQWSDFTEKVKNPHTYEGLAVDGLLLMTAVKGLKGGVVAEGGAGAQGGLNLFKFEAEQTFKAGGWKTGDRMLKMYDQGSPKLNWKQNSGFLRREMRTGNPIFDSYRLPNGNLIPKQGFLGAERNLLQSRGWNYTPSKGAWLPPGT